jgi:hypothetical protein
MPGAVLIIRRTAPLQPALRLCGELLFHDLHQAGFANPGLTAEYHHLPQPVCGLSPPLAQQGAFHVPAHKGSQRTLGHYLEAGLDLAVSEHVVRRARCVRGCEWGYGDLLPGEIALDQARRGRTDDHTAQGGEILEPGSHSGGLANG